MVKKPISIQLPDNRSISLLADPFEKVYCLKHRIEELESIPISSQRLTYHFKELADENLITTYNIKSNALLKLSLKSVSCTPTIVIHSDEGVKYTLKIDLNDTIKEIKLKLNTIFGAEITDKNIVLNGKVLNDRMTLFGYEIKPNDVLYLEDSKIMVYVQVGGGEIQAIPLKIDTTVVELKQNILQDDLSTKQAKLFFNGAELKCNYKTLKQYGIKHNSKLYLF